jgi:pimeloyl-ACP methyl ester carboxylesterase
MEPRGFVHGARPGAPASTPRSQSSDDGAAPAPVPRDARPLPVVTADGVLLSALVYGNPDAEVAVVFGHGFTGTQRNPKVVGLARELADTGLAVYTTDFRGHGASAGRSTFGVREVYDLDAVVVVARARHARVVTAGASMGGFVALRHLALGGTVDAVVAISSPAFGSIPRLPRARLLRRVVRSERGRRLLERRGTRVSSEVPHELPSLDSLPVLPAVPVVIVHGARDRYVPLSEAQALQERLKGPTRLVVLPGFGHGEAAFDPGFGMAMGRLVRELLVETSRSSGGS